MQTTPSPNNNNPNSQHSSNETIQHQIQQTQYLDMAFPSEYYTTFTANQLEMQSITNDNESFAANDTPIYQNTHTDTNSENYFNSNDFQNNPNLQSTIWNKIAKLGGIFYN
jgi:hypothetical protein